MEQLPLEVMQSPTNNVNYIGNSYCFLLLVLNIQNFYEPKLSVEKYTCDLNFTKHIHHMVKITVYEQAKQF